MFILQLRLKFSNVHRATICLEIVLLGHYTTLYFSLSFTNYVNTCEVFFITQFIFRIYGNVQLQSGNSRKLCK